MELANKGKNEGEEEMIRNDGIVENYEHINILER